MSEPNTNYRSTAPCYGMADMDLLRREYLRIRISRGHADWADTEPVRISAGRLPPAETGLTKHIMYEGDGRIPEDILGMPRVWEGQADD